MHCRKCHFYVSLNRYFMRPWSGKILPYLRGKSLTCCWFIFKKVTVYLSYIGPAKIHCFSWSFMSSTVLSLYRECHRDQDEYFRHQLRPSVWHRDGELICSKHCRYTLLDKFKHTCLQSFARQLSLFLDGIIIFTFHETDTAAPASPAAATLMSVFEDWLFLSVNETKWMLTT